MEALYAVLGDVKTGALGEAEAIERLDRFPHWVWVAMDPESKVILTIDVSERTLAMAQLVVHHVVQVLAPACAPLFLTDGLREYMTALLAHDGQWVQPPRRQATGPAPKPRWVPLPQLLYAQVVKTLRQAAPGAGKAPRGVRHPGNRPTGVSGVRLAHQHGFRGAPQSRHPPACRGGRTTSQHAV